MPKKIKPKWGWSGAGSFPPSPLSDDDFILISESLGLEKIKKDYQARIVQAIYDYYSNHAILDNRPRPSNIKAALKVIQSETKKFAQMLQSIDSATHDVIVKTDIHQKRLLSDPSGNGLNTAWPVDNIDDTIERCRQDTKKINQLCRKTLILMDEKFKDTGGPTKKRRAMRRLLLTLKNIFEDMTGEKATAPSINTDGKYFDFAKTVINRGLANIEDPIQDSTLTAQIRKIF
jgi:hypothetical protein